LIQPGDQITFIFAGKKSEDYSLDKQDYPGTFFIEDNYSLIIADGREFKFTTDGLNTLDNFLADEMILINNYLSFYDIESVNEENIIEFYEFYQEWIFEIKVVTENSKKNVIFKHHGSDYKKIFDSKYRRILTAKKIKE
jgi:hypothetical protein